MTASTSRTYQDAIELLNTCQSNAATIAAIRKSGGAMNQFAIPEMVEYLRRIGYRPEDLNALNVIHITGTKGKGSTSAFVEQISRAKIMESGARQDMETDDEEERGWIGGIGLYTSPHLCAVRERIRVNGHPLPEHLFAKYFFQVWDRLSSYTSSSSHALASTSSDSNLEEHLRGIPEKPVYFRFLTLLAYHVFISLRVKLTVLEVGIGGTYDSTNLVPKPLATGVTALGLDHTFVLGNTVQEIAWNKGGIFKEGVPALAVEQDEGAKVAEDTLRERAIELKASSFDLVPVYPELKQIKLGLPGVHQTINASLAVALCKTVFASASTQLPEVLQPYHDSKLGEENVPKAFVSALERTRWPGRCQSVIDPTSTDTRRTTWFLDGAHTVESLTSCGEWVFSKDGFSKQTDTKKTRVLVFNCTSERSAHALLDALLKAGKGVTGQTAAAVGQGFDKVIFCTNVTYTDGHFKGDLTSKAIDPNDLSALATQHACADAWAEFVPEASKEQVTVVPSIQHAVNRIREAEKANDADVEVLVAGSLHLVGGVMEVAGLAERALSVA